MLWSCDNCIKYQDLALVEKAYGIDSYIDSVAMVTKDSIVGCGNSRRKVLGSKTHGIRFPIIARIQLFSQGNLWKEFFVEMDKNTNLIVFTGHGCSYDTFPSRLKLAKEQNRFIDLSFTDDYCWLLEKIIVSDYEYERCTEYSLDGTVDSEQDLCGPYFL
jgi:hypothetical protein